MRVRPLGVGLVYSSELDTLFREDNPHLGVLELEPQTLWDRTFPTSAGGSPVYIPNASALQRIADLPQHKLIHSVGFPVGGSASLGDHHIAPLAAVATQMKAQWVSEHLSFNATQSGKKTRQAGFLLPPRQTRAGVSVAAANIRKLSASMPVPFAFETGVNYLRPRSDELKDGEFFAAIAEQADCGILLDLHNLWVNERNGRQRVKDVLESLPLERVWEVHLAGGMTLCDYYLDSHSDPISSDLLAIAADVIPHLPNLGAVLFEILSGFVSRVGIDVVRDQLPLLRDLWKLRPPRELRICRRAMRDTLDRACDDIDVHDWERTLASLVAGANCDQRTTAFNSLATDPGVNVLRILIDEARSGRVSRALHLTITLLLLHLGPAAVRALLKEYQAHCAPDVFTSGEADAFATFLWERTGRLRDVPFLTEVLTFEHAMIRATLYGEPSRVDWHCDPAELFEELERGRIPNRVAPVEFSMEIRAR
jgi:uncharacterized protein (UPF0276 family)